MRISDWVQTCALPIWERGWGEGALTIGTVTRVTGRVGGAAAGLGISHANGLPMMRSLAWLALLATSLALATALAATPQPPYTLPPPLEHPRVFVDAQATSEACRGGKRLVSQWRSRVSQ